MNSAIAHDYLADAQKHFSGHPPQNYFVADKMAGTDFSPSKIRGLNFSNPNQLFFPVVFTSHEGRKFPKAFSACGIPLPFFFGQDSNLVAGLTNGMGKTLCSILELSLLKTS